MAAVLKEKHRMTAGLSESIDFKSISNTHLAFQTPMLAAKSQDISNFPLRDIPDLHFRKPIYGNPPRLPSGRLRAAPASPPWHTAAVSCLRPYHILQAAVQKTHPCPPQAHSPAGNEIPPQKHSLPAYSVLSPLQFPSKIP